MVAPAGIFVELVADGHRGDIHLSYGFVGVFAAVGVVAAGVGEGEEEEEGGEESGGLHGRLAVGQMLLSRDGWLV